MWNTIAFLNKGVWKTASMKDWKWRNADVYLCICVMCTQMSHKSSRGHLLAHWHVHNTEAHTNVHTEQNSSDLLGSCAGHAHIIWTLHWWRCREAAFLSSRSPSAQTCNTQTYFHIHIKKGPSRFSDNTLPKPRKALVQLAPRQDKTWLWPRCILDLWKRAVSPFCVPIENKLYKGE